MYTEEFDHVIVLPPAISPPRKVPFFEGIADFQWPRHACP